MSVTDDRYAEVWHRTACTYISLILVVAVRSGLIFACARACIYTDKQVSYIFAKGGKCVFCKFPEFHKRCLNRTVCGSSSIPWNAKFVKAKCVFLLQLFSSGWSNLLQVLPTLLKFHRTSLPASLDMWILKQTRMLLRYHFHLRYIRVGDPYNCQISIIIRPTQYSMPARY